MRVRIRSGISEIYGFSAAEKPVQYVGTCGAQRETGCHTRVPYTKMTHRIIFGDFTITGKGCNDECGRWRHEGREQGARRDGIRVGSDDHTLIGAFLEGGQRRPAD